jgi:hypothetical protein
MFQSVQLNLDGDGGWGGEREREKKKKKKYEDWKTSQKRVLFVAKSIQLYSEYPIKGALEALGNFKMGGQVIGTVKYADDLVALVRGETALQGMIERLIESGQCYGTAMNAETN